MRRIITSMSVALLALTGMSVANASIWAEVGDAGELPGSAQVPSVAGSLDAITGEVGGSSSDMYQIYICDPDHFSATTVGTPGSLFDTQLFLFNSAGVGVLANDDSAGSLRSTLPAGAAALTAGVYYLALSGFDYDPRDAGGGLIFPSFPFTGVFGPIDGDAIAGWGGGSGGGSYHIGLAGACTVPSPDAGLLGMLGVCTIAALRRRMK